MISTTFTILENLTKRDLYPHAGWGLKDDLQALLAAARECGIGIYWDTVLNHKAGADFTEKFSAVKVNPDGIKVTPILWKGLSKAYVKTDRNVVISKLESVSGWVGFDFPGRKIQHDEVSPPTL
jgi:alpha-amylase